MKCKDIEDFETLITRLTWLVVTELVRGNALRPVIMNLCWQVMAWEEANQTEKPRGRKPKGAIR